MKPLGYISVTGLVALAVTVAPAQDGRKSGPPPRFASPAPQRQGPPPTLQRGDSRPQQQQPPQQQPDQQPRSFDRFILHGPGPHSGDWLRQHENLPPEEQKKALQSDPQFQRLPKDRQQQLMQRLEHFSVLPHDQRDRMLQRMETLEHLSPDQRDKARAMFRSFRDLPQDRRQELNRAFLQLEQMSPEERQKAIDSDEYRRNYSDKERDLLRGMSEMGLTPNGTRRNP